MASGPNLPPQAYTREILTAAFNWLQTQPDSVRKMATTPDALVGIFTRAKRFGNSSIEADAPVSSQNFMSDLKNLAEGLREFDEPARRTLGSAAMGGGTTVASAQIPAAPRDSGMHGGVPSGTGMYAGASSQPTSHATSAVHSLANTVAASLGSSANSSPGPQLSLSALNERSRGMIQEVKTELNLSSDAEAINMMLAVAYKSLKDLLT